MDLFILLSIARGSVVFWPSTRPKMPFKVMQRKEVTHSNGSYERKSCRWARLIIWDKVKVPIQSDAPEESDLWTAWQLFPLDDDQTCHSKDWVGDWVGVELLYNSVKTEVRQLETELETRYGRESHARPKGLSEHPMSWGPDQLVIRSRKESHHPAESWAPGPPVEQPWRTRKTQRWRPWESRVNILQFCPISSSLSHTNVTIKWEVYILLKKSSPVCYSCVGMYPAYICIYVLCVYGYTTAEW